MTAAASPVILALAVGLSITLSGATPPAAVPAQEPPTSEPRSDVRHATPDAAATQVRRDAFGGLLALKFEATGWFRLGRFGERTLLVTHLGCDPAHELSDPSGCPPTSKGCAAEAATS